MMLEIKNKLQCHSWHLFRTVGLHLMIYSSYRYAFISDIHSSKNLRKFRKEEESNESKLAKEKEKDRSMNLCPLRLRFSECNLEVHVFKKGKVSLTIFFSQFSVNAYVVIYD